MKNIVLNILSTRFLDIIPLTLISIFLFASYWNNSFQFYSGLILFLVGFLIWLIGLINLGKSFHGLVYAKELITTGIYSKIKHPIYLGSALFFIGLSISTLSYWIVSFALILTIVQIIRAKLEEKKLEIKFGKKYLKYKKNTWF